MTRVYGQRCTLGELLAASTLHVHEFTTREQLLAAVQWLDITGDVVWCRPARREEPVPEAKEDQNAEGNAADPAQTNITTEKDDDTIFLDPTWLCQTLVGRMTASVELLEKQGKEVVWVDGLHNPPIAQVMAFARLLDLNVSVYDICHVFKHFKLGVRYTPQNDGGDRIMVPLRLTGHAFAVVDRSVLDGCERVLGRQLRARPPNVFVPGFFPQLQLKAFQEHHALLWRSGLLLKHGTAHGEAYAIVESVELAALDESATAAEAAMTHVTALNIYVWGHAAPGPENDPMMELLRTCEKLVTKVLFEMVGVGEAELRQHRLEMLALGPGCVRQWTEGHRTPCTYQLYRDTTGGTARVEQLQLCRRGFDPIQTTTPAMLITGRARTPEFDPTPEILRFLQQWGEFFQQWHATNSASAPSSERRRRRDV